MDNWEMTEEPTPRELALLDRRASEFLCSFTQTIIDEAAEEAKKPFIPYLDGLAAEAFRQLMTRAALWRKHFGRKPTSDEFNIFRMEAVRSVTPYVSSRHEKEVQAEIAFEIASKLGKMLAEITREKKARKEREKLLGRKKRKAKTRAEFRAEMDKAGEAMKHGVIYNGLFLTGQPSLKAPRVHKGKKSPFKEKIKRWPKKRQEGEPGQGELGPIFKHADDENFRRAFGKLPPDV